MHHFYGRDAGFQEAENSTVHGHVIVLLDGEYIDLTLDQFPEYPEYSRLKLSSQVAHWENFCAIS